MLPEEIPLLSVVELANYIEKKEIMVRILKDITNF